MNSPPSAIGGDRAAKLHAVAEQHDLAAPGAASGEPPPARPARRLCSQYDLFISTPLSAGCRSSASRSAMNAPCRSSASVLASISTSRSVPAASSSDASAFRAVRAKRRVIFREPREFDRALGLAEVRERLGRGEPHPRRRAFQPDAQAPPAVAAERFQLHRRGQRGCRVHQLFFELLPVGAVRGQRQVRHLPGDEQEAVVVVPVRGRHVHEDEFARLRLGDLEIRVGGAVEGGVEPLGDGRGDPRVLVVRVQEQVVRAVRADRARRRRWTRRGTPGGRPRPRPAVAACRCPARSSPRRSGPWAFAHTLPMRNVGPLGPRGRSPRSCDWTLPVVSEVNSSHGNSTPPCRLVVWLSSGSVTCTSIGSPFRAGRNRAPRPARARSCATELSSTSFRLSVWSRFIFLRLSSSIVRQPPGGGLLPVPGSWYTSPTPLTTSGSVLLTLVFAPIGDDGVRVGRVFADLRARRHLGRVGLGGLAPGRAPRLRTRPTTPGSCAGSAPRVFHARFMRSSLNGGATGRPIPPNRATRREHSLSIESRRDSRTQGHVKSSLRRNLRKRAEISQLDE